MSSSNNSDSGEETSALITSRWAGVGTSESVDQDSGGSMGDDSSTRRRGTNRSSGSGGESDDTAAGFQGWQEQAQPPVIEVDAATPSDDIDEEELKYGAKHVIMIFVPVTLCMIIVVATIKSVTYYSQKDIYLIYTPFHEDSDDPATIVWQSLANGFILLAVVVVMTVIFILLYKYECYKVIHGWLIVTTVILFFFFAYVYLLELIRGINIPVDYVTLAIFMWNFGVVGLMVIHWKGPLMLQQGYLIIISGLISLTFFKYLPPYSTWVILGLLSIWDLVAVLCPKGPLRILVETAQERNEPLFPALIYSSAMAWYTTTTMAQGSDVEEGSGSERPTRTSAMSNESGPADGADSDLVLGRRDRNLTASGAARTLNNDDQSQIPSVSLVEGQQIRSGNGRQGQDEEDRGVKLGLGDFIFYSLLVGKASFDGDWNTTFACFIAILIGLCLTLLLLAIFRRALPALPISICFGIVFFFSTNVVVQPFADRLTSSQIFM